MYCCESCGIEAPLASVSFTKNIGMFVVRQEETVAGTFCKTCIRQYYKDYQTANLLGGWWGTISMIITPVYFFQNMGVWRGVKNMPEVPHTASRPFLNEQLWEHLVEFQPLIEQLFHDGTPPRRMVQILSAESGVTPGTADLFLRQVSRQLHQQRLQQNMQNRQQRPRKQPPRAPQLPGGKQLKLPARRPPAS
ncbi:MAG: hypothetical protein KDB82_08325 [Planctomycetes bacterium]|nr:hypothetical protein [Planctomycetota bacterium]